MNFLSIARVSVWSLLVSLFSMAGFAVAAQDSAEPTTQAARAAIFAQAKLPEMVKLPVPGKAISLPDDWDSKDVPFSIQLSQQPPGEVLIRRVSKNDGRLYLEIYSTAGPLSGSASIDRGPQDLGEQPLDGSLWLSLKPKIGLITFDVLTPDSKTPQKLTAPTTLIEIRGRQIFLNGEVFLLKGATGQVKNQQEADFVHSLGLNALRGAGAIGCCKQFGFMSIASMSLGEHATPPVMKQPDEEFEQNIPESIQWLKENCTEALDSPNTLILQLGNEKVNEGARPGEGPLSLPRRHVMQLLAAARNFVKPLAPMLPIGYANEDIGFLAPDFMDVYMHNSFLAKDRYKYPWDDFVRWQGCLPPDGPTHQGRPFVNSEFGANAYLCQAYHKGPNNPFLERIHAWNFTQRWAEFMEHETVGGSIYRLDDLAKPLDQGCSCFGIVTNNFTPKLACWEIRHMWRDFEIAASGKQLVISYKRDYWARNCRLSIASIDGTEAKIELKDFVPREVRTIDLSAPQQFRWTIDFTTHGGLIGKATGAYPAELEERDFLDSLKGRETYPFLRELFDTEVLTADGKPAPRTLAEMTNADRVIPVALRKRNGVVYLLLISRQVPTDDPIRHGITIDVAFHGNVSRINDMTGDPLPESVDFKSTPTGLRLNRIDAARIPSAIGKRSDKPFMLPIYKITP